VVSLGLGLGLLGLAPLLIFELPSLCLIVRRLGTGPVTVRAEKIARVMVPSDALAAEDRVLLAPAAVSCPLPHARLQSVTGDPQYSSHERLPFRSLNPPDSGTCHGERQWHWNEKGIAFHIDETQAAVERYNGLADQGIRVGGLFHSTC
jgi:hypothetical protein